VFSLARLILAESTVSAWSMSWFGSKGLAIQWLAPDSMIRFHWTGSPFLGLIYKNVVSDPFGSKNRLFFVSGLVERGLCNC